MFDIERIREDRLYNVTNRNRRVQKPLTIQHAIQEVHTRVLFENDDQEMSQEQIAQWRDKLKAGLAIDGVEHLISVEERVYTMAVLAYLETFDK